MPIINDNGCTDKQCNNKRRFMKYIGTLSFKVGMMYLADQIVTHQYNQNRNERCRQHDSGKDIGSKKTPAVRNRHTFKKSVYGRRIDIKTCQANTAECGINKYGNNSDPTQSMQGVIGAFAAIMGGVDAIVFTAGIGENGIGNRDAICNGLEYLGTRIDSERNNIRGKEQEISAEGSKVKIFVIPTNEEIMIARDTQRITGALKK